MPRTEQSATRISPKNGRGPTDGLSSAATIRQSAKLGLPKFREQICSSRITNVAPLPDKVARKLYAERAEDMDSIRRFIVAQPKDAQ